jgi:glycosyltransferase involved in cell wall biosynthesis
LQLSIVIPAYNEEANLSALLPELLEVCTGYDFEWEVLVVDDGSTDGTLDLIRSMTERFENLRFLHFFANQGMGTALTLGSKSARGEVVVWLMADRSDRLEDIRKLYEKVNDGLDLVIASRAMEGGSYGELGGVKASLSHAYSQVARVWFGIRAQDLTNAFRATRQSLFDSLDLRSRDFAISPELAIKAHLAGARIGQIPTVYSFRSQGHSSFRILSMGLRYSRLLLYKFFKPRTLR